MKWIASLLMIANVFIFLRVSDRQVDPGLQAAQLSPDINRESMLLLRETRPALTPLEASPVVQQEDGLEIAALDDRELVQVSTDGNQDIVTTASTAPSGSETDSAGQTVTAAEVALAKNANQIIWSCYRVGPFREQSAWQLATRWADDNEVSFKSVRSERGN